MGEMLFNENKVSGAVGGNLGIDEDTDELRCDVRCPYCAKLIRVVVRPYARCKECNEIFAVTIV